MSYLVPVCPSADEASQLSSTPNVSESCIRLFPNWRKQDTIVYDRLGICFEKLFVLINDRPFVVYRKKEDYYINVRLVYDHPQIEVIHPLEDGMTKEQAEAILFSR
jgi:hypothetical protein